MDSDSRQASLASHDPLSGDESWTSALLHEAVIGLQFSSMEGTLVDLLRFSLRKAAVPEVDPDLAQSRTEAPGLWAELSPYRFADQSALVQHRDRFASWGLCELLCRESTKVAPGDPERAVELAELAVIVTNLLKKSPLANRRWLHQLRGYAWAHVGNARRALGDLRNADEAFLIADAWWESGSEGVGDVLGYEPVLLDLKASLRIAQRRFPEAMELLDRTFEIFFQGTDPKRRDLHLSGRALVMKALALFEMGEHEESIFLLRRAEPLVDAQRDPRLYLCLKHNLLLNLTSTGRHQEARTLLPEVWALCRELGKPLDIVRLRWAEGRIAAGLGQTDLAIRTFRELRDEFASRGISYDAALVALELAALYAEQGRSGEVKDLAMEMVEIFRSQNVPREALAAVLVFQNAAARKRATASLAREIVAFLEKARHDPALRFVRRRGASASVSPRPRKSAATTA